VTGILARAIDAAIEAAQKMLTAKPSEVADRATEAAVAALAVKQAADATDAGDDRAKVLLTLKGVPVPSGVSSIQRVAKVKAPEPVRERKFKPIPTLPSR
jgi:hypothetical protein